MTLLEATSWSFVRAVMVGLVVAFAVQPTFRGMRHAAVRLSVGDQRVWPVLLWACVLLPAVAPGLLIGYAYRPEGLRWVITPWKADLLHAAISIARTLPWGMLIAVVIGDPTESQPVIAWEQTRGCRSKLPHYYGRVLLWLMRRRATIAAGVFAAMLTFGEAEVAALVQARGWTEWTFRKLAGGWTGGELAVQLWPVVVVVLSAVACLIRLILGARNGRAMPTADQHLSSHPWHTGLAWIVVGVGCCVAVVIPAARLVGAASRGFEAVWRQTTFLTEIGHTIVAASVVAFGVSVITSILLRSRHRLAVGLRSLLFCFVTVGAFGSMLASVLALSLAFLPTASTVLHQYCVLAAVLSPLAVATSLHVGRRETSRPVFVSRMLLGHADAGVRGIARRAYWRSVSGPACASFGLLYWLAFWDLQSAALLAPPGYATAPGRLYNLAHYGQNETLAAMLLVLAAVAVAIPGAVLVLSYPWRTR